MLAVDELHWYAVTCRPQRESATVEILNRRGFIGYVPMRTKRVRARKHPCAWDDRRFPIIPSLVFVGASDALGPYGWHAVMGVRTVSGIVGDEGGPLAIPAWQIRRMVARNGDEERELVTQVAGVNVRAGDRARMTEGAFEGIEGKVVHLTGHRARLLMELLGSEREIEVDARTLDKPAAE